MGKKAAKAAEEEKKKKEGDPNCKKDKIIVWYGTQTGTAESFAGQLVEGFVELDLKMKVECKNIEDFDPDEFKKQEMYQSYHFFLVSTYGEGDPPDSCIDFYEFWSDNVDAHKAGKNTDIDYTKMTV